METNNKGKFLNLPNIITLSRLIPFFVFVYMLLNEYPKSLLIIVFGIAAVSDWLDGFLARRLKQTTAAGARLDQIIDRVFTVLVVGSLFYYYSTHSADSKQMALLLLTVSREIVGLPGVLIAFMRRKFAYQVKCTGKITTFIQGFAFGAIILSVNWAIFLVIPAFVSGVISAVDYLRYSVS